MSLLSKRISSRTIMVAGGFFKFAGMLVYACPSSRLWTLILGYILLLKGAIFVLTATITLFTQMLAHRCTPSMVAVLASMFALGRRACRSLSPWSSRCLRGVKERCNKRAVMHFMCGYKNERERSKIDTPGKK